MQQPRVDYLLCDQNSFDQKSLRAEQGQHASLCELALLEPIEDTSTHKPLPLHGDGMESASELDLGRKQLSRAETACSDIMEELLWLSNLRDEHSFEISSQAENQTQIESTRYKT